MEDSGIQNQRRWRLSRIPVALALRTHIAGEKGVTFRGDAGYGHSGSGVELRVEELGRMSLPGFGVVLRLGGCG